jgi:hypothetical protein
MHTNPLRFASSVLIYSTLLTAPTFGQGFFDQMKEKASGSLGIKNNSAKPSKSMLKAADADSADTMLDEKAKAIKPDKYGMGGIWYSTKPIRLKNDLGQTGLIGKKFLLEYDEANYRLKFSTRYAYEASNRAKLVRAGVWLSESIPPKIAFDQAIKEGHFALPSYGSDNHNYIYTTYVPNEDLQGNIKRGEAIETTFSTEFVEIEKGVAVVMQNKYYSTRKMDDREKAMAALEDFVVLFRKEKAQRAYAVTYEEVHKFFSDYRSRLEKANKNMDKGDALPRPGDANASPEFARVLKEGPALFKAALAKQPKLAHYQPLYAYVYNNNPSWDVVKNVRDGRQVAVGRMVGVYVVCLNTKPAKEDGDLLGGYYAQVKNKYVYFYTGIYEDMKGNAYNINEYSGKLYFTGHGMGPYPIAAGENAMKHKK